MTHSPCAVCGQDTSRVRERMEWPVGNRRAVVEVEHERCTACGESFMTPEQMDAAQRAASYAIRLEERLLMPDEITRIRVAAGLTQTQFEQVLRVGRKTVVRWERGTVFQSPSTDELIRVYDANPALLDERCRALGIERRKDGKENLGWGQTASVTYVAPDIAPCEPSGRILPFATRRNTATTLVLEREAELPDIPKENLR